MKKSMFAFVIVLALALGACGEDMGSNHTGTVGATCAINNGGCPAGSTCSVQSMQIVCTPNQPAAGICTVSNGGCDANATCMQIGTNSRTCACKTGYTGDGMSCTSVVADSGNGFGPGPYNIVVELSTRTGFVNGCAGDQFSVTTGAFACLWNPLWETPIAPRTGTSVSFTIPAMPERASLEFYFNDCKDPGASVNLVCAISLAADTLTLMKDPNLKVTINGILVGQSLQLFRDSQRRTGCPNGCPNGRIRLR